ncbi:MAG: hypothetical protein GTN40_03020 [Candidatus Aenigmarchaeota archaeon]|nr:hypothetical protein [Candidatus Aenigmarchaeota archaeon]
MLITDIKKQEKRNRYNIFIDKKYSFSLSDLELSLSGLSIGDEVTEKRIEKLKKESSEGKAKDKALRLLSFRPRSEKEIEKRLVEKGFGEKTIIETKKKLKTLNLLGDLEFAKSWIKNRITLRPTGKRRLFLELKEKGVKEEIIEKALEILDPDQEFKLALKEAQKKKERLKGLSKLELKQKITSFLARRGFSWEVIKKVFEELE